jgi:hypothetical protein
VIASHEDVTCYAESRDGIHWTRPSLGLVEFQGSRDNNIVLKGHSHAFSPFKDRNPKAPPAERYKAVAIGRVGKKSVLLGFASPDGLRWSQIRPEPIITDGAFDTLNRALWDTERSEYVCFYRDFRHGIREIKVSTSSDFLTWKPGEWFDFGSLPTEHLYTNAAHPYFRAPHLYIGFPMRFVPWRTYLPAAPHPGVSDGMFMTSRDGVRWNRFMEAFVRPGREERDWNQRSQIVAPEVVPTGPDEMSLYIQRHNAAPTFYLERLTLRTDGFVSLHAGYPGGECVTKPLTWEGGDLYLNYATSAAGQIRVEIQDLTGQPLPGFALEDGPPLFGDQIEGLVKWPRAEGSSNVKPLSRLAGKVVRLRIVMRDADLYALRFR